MHNMNPSHTLDNNLDYSEINKLVNSNAEQGL